MQQKVTFDAAELFWISRLPQDLSLHKRLLFRYLKNGVTFPRTVFFTDDDMQAHRRDTSGETVLQNHRKEAHLKSQLRKVSDTNNPTKTTQK